MTRQSQCDRVLEALKGGPKTTFQLGYGLNICCVTKRISELREDGQLILTTKEKRSGRWVFIYTLEGHSGMPASAPQLTSAALQRETMSKGPICANPACGRTFKPKRKSQHYCSARCRFEDWDRQHPRTGTIRASTRNPQADLFTNEIAR